MTRLISSVLALWLSVVRVWSQNFSMSPLRPPAIPLAVKSPYLNIWLPTGPDGGDRGVLPGVWPTFWTGAIIGWAGFIRVDNETYTWMGKPGSAPELVNQTNFEYSSTRSIFTFDCAGKIRLTATFLSPVFPKDERLQSVSLSYLFLDVQSFDGQNHDVQIYTDTSAEWVSGDRSQFVKWDSGTTGHDQAVKYHRFYRQQQDEFKEDSEQAAWGTWYYSAASKEGLTYAVAEDTIARGQFHRSGFLNNASDNNYRAINDRFPVFAFAQDMGQVGSTIKRAEFAISLFQTRVLQFTSSPGNTEQLSGLWPSYWSRDTDALAEFFSDVEAIETKATQLDNTVATDSKAVGGDDYVAITALAVRQAYGTLQLAGEPGKQYVFLKEISSGSFVSTTDVIFPLMPILLYLNPKWIKFMLDPLFINQESLVQPNSSFALHDLGKYPNALGYPSSTPEEQPLEECGDMIIMSLIYAQRTGDTQYLSDHYHMLHQWAGFLVADSLYPMNQISTDDFAGPLVNQTNLALKGMIGLQAMGMIANMTGHEQDGANFTDIAASYIREWQTLGINNAPSPPHTTLNYGNSSSYGLLYNLYADRLLGTNLVPRDIYVMQSNFYPTVQQKYGVPLDSRHDWGKNDWEVWAAAIAEDNTRTSMLRTLVKFINDTPTSGPVTDLYNVNSGQFPEGGPQFTARPVVGGWFALLGLKDLGIPTA